MVGGGNLSPDKWKQKVSKIVTKNQVYVEVSPNLIQNEGVSTTYPRCSQIFQSCYGSADINYTKISCESRTTHFQTKNRPRGKKSEMCGEILVIWDRMIWCTFSYSQWNKRRTLIFEEELK